MAPPLGCGVRTAVCLISQEHINTESIFNPVGFSEAYNTLYCNTLQYITLLQYNTLYCSFNTSGRRFSGPNISFLFSQVSAG